MHREQLADTLMLGLSSVAHSILIPDDKEFAPLDPAVVRYEYDPRRATQMLEAMGYTRGSDRLFRDAANQRITVEMRATVIDILQKTVLALADDWQQVGVVVEPHSIAPARQADREYRATFPAFDTSRGNNSAESFKTFLSSEARVRETGYAGQNFPSYTNAELDALINRYLVAIPVPERMEAGRGIVHHMSDQVVVLPVFYDVVGTMTGNRLRGVPRSAAQSKTTTWNAHEWDV
jgi:ABC-type transport system substrate-binding protein